MSLDATVVARLGEFVLDASIHAEAGEMVAVVGPNGAGKTTLLRALAGLVPLRSGRVVLDGEVLADVAAGIALAPERRPVALMFQEVLLFPHLSVRDNVAFGVRARGVARSRALDAADAWLDRVGLAGRGSDRPSRLSGGERQRVALARALVTEPRLLLLDEPFAAVDVSGRRELREALQEQLAGYSGVRLLVTHDPGEAVALAERVVVLEQGRVTQAGTFDEVGARPRTDWAGAMLGGFVDGGGRLSEGRWR